MSYDSELIVVVFDYFANSELVPRGKRTVAVLPFKLDTVIFEVYLKFMTS